MRRLLGRTGWASFATFFSAALMAAGLSLTAAQPKRHLSCRRVKRSPTLPAIPRAIPQKEAYELYDPKIGKNFDLKNFWMRADLRVRPEMRNNVCFGSAMSLGKRRPQALAARSQLAMVPVTVTQSTIRQIRTALRGRPMTSLCNSGCVSVSAMTSRRT